MPGPDFTASLTHYREAITGALTPTPGRIFSQPGGEVAWDQCDCDGQAWSRIVSLTPVIGTRKANGIACVEWWDVTFAVGVLRCVQGPTQRGNPPSATAVTADAERFATDLLALMAVIENDPYVRQITQATPLGPQGGCAGSEVQFIVRLEPCRE
uniref:Tail terminator n=1 Tax=Microbacterium phage Sunny TaxID=3144828 RepID=A0AAU7J891_9VIRU